MKVYLSKPTRKHKKYSILVGHKKINFGDDRYEDFTQHQDPKRKALYIQRHKKNEEWNNPLTAGFWSRYLLWEKPTIEESKKYIFNKFGIMIVHV